jgi:hypothetical protein
MAILVNPFEKGKILKEICGDQDEGLGGQHGQFVHKIAIASLFSNLGFRFCTKVNFCQKFL